MLNIADNRFQWNRQNPTPPNPPPLRPAPPAPRPRAPNPLHLHRTPPPHLAPDPTPSYPSHSPRPPLPALPLPHPDAPNSRSRIAGPYPNLPAARRARPAPNRALHHRFHRGELSRREARWGDDVAFAVGAGVSLHAACSARRAVALAG